MVRVRDWFKSSRELMRKNFFDFVFGKAALMDRKTLNRFRKKFSPFTYFGMLAWEYKSTYGFPIEDSRKIFEEYWKNLKLEDKLVLIRLCKKVKALLAYLEEQLCRKQQEQVQVLQGAQIGQ